MKFFVFYLPSQKKFFWTIKESAREAWTTLKKSMGWTYFWITERDCKLIMHLEFPPEK